jgi:predicted amidophosphoribosyltransferase
MNSSSGRIGRERRTIAAMVTIYCRGKHGGKELCPECVELLSYCDRRLDLCPFKEEKPACLNCRVHCYSPQMRERIVPVMYYSGPRLLFRHPVLAIQHLADQRRRSTLKPVDVR